MNLLKDNGLFITRSACERQMVPRSRFGLGRVFRLLVVFGLVVHVIHGSAAADQQPPNIVMVFIDDMGWGDFSCFGNRDAQTPKE